MEIIGIDKTLQSMEEAIAHFEEGAHYELSSAERAIFQYAWMVSATKTMVETTKQFTEMKQTMKDGADDAT